MRVLHLSTGVGKSSANTRIHLALREEGIDSKILLLERKSDIGYTYLCENTWINQIKNAILRRIEIFYLNKKYPNRENVVFSTALYGTDIVKNKLIEEADIIHLHWINGSYLSIKGIENILNTGKPVVWTTHDSWALTGGCHVRYGCANFEHECGNCRMLLSDKEKDISNYIYCKKKKIFQNRNKITFIAPSEWMYQNIERSSLFKNNKCYLIPNTLDIQTFQPKSLLVIEKSLSYKKNKEKFHMLFGAVSSITTPYKGFQYLVKALEMLLEKEKELQKHLVIHIFGADSSDVAILKKYECKFWGYIDNQEKMACLYSMADVYLFPSVDDNLPNTVMESLACATPVVAFKTGGVPDMVKHKENGYIAEYKNAEDLYKGMMEVREKNIDNIWGNNGRKKVLREYSPSVIAKKYIKVYNDILGEIDD